MTNVGPGEGVDAVEEEEDGTDMAEGGTVVRGESERGLGVYVPGRGMTVEM